MNPLTLIIGGKNIDTYFDALRAYNKRMERQHAVATTPAELRAALCPYPIGTDHSVGACVDAGHCGCDAGLKLGRTQETSG